MRLIVTEKTGFVSQSPEVCIYKNGMPFYSMKRKGAIIAFNMPRGDYEVQKGIMTKRNVINYPLIQLPKPDVNGQLPKKIKITYRENKYKCSVDISDNVTMKVYFDPMFKNYPEWVRDWILGHEAGHFRYRGKGTESEKNCDLFACNTMLISGFNPSQIQAAIDVSLSNGIISEHRKENMYESLKNVEQKLHSIKHLEHGF